MASERSWKAAGGSGPTLPLFGVGGPIYGATLPPLWGRRVHMGSEGLFGVEGCPYLGLTVHMGSIYGAALPPCGVEGSIWGQRVHLGSIYGAILPPCGVRGSFWGRRVHMGSIYGATLPPCGVEGYLWGLFVVQCCPLVAKVRYCYGVEGCPYLGSEGPFMGQRCPLVGSKGPYGVHMGSIYGAMLPPGGQSPLLHWGRRLPLFGAEGPYGVEGCPYLGSEGPYGVLMGCSAAPLWGYRVLMGSVWGAVLPPGGVME